MVALVDIVVMVAMVTMLDHDNRGIVVNLATYMSWHAMTCHDMYSHDVETYHDLSEHVRIFYNMRLHINSDMS